MAEFTWRKNPPLPAWRRNPMNRHRLKNSCIRACWRPADGCMAFCLPGGSSISACRKITGAPLQYWQTSNRLQKKSFPFSLREARRDHRRCPADIGAVERVHGMFVHPGRNQDEGGFTAIFPPPPNPLPEGEGKQCALF